jgi:hypothetical protein
MFHLLRRGPKTEWDLKMEINLPWADIDRDPYTDAKDSSSQTLVKRLKDLVEKRFLEIREVFDGKELFYLTPFGLAATCVRRIGAPSELRKTMTTGYLHWKDFLPLVFSKWELFINEDVDYLACLNLIETSQLMIREYYAHIQAFKEWQTHRRQNEKISEPSISTHPDTYGWFFFSSGPRKPGFPSDSQQEEAFLLRFYIYEKQSFKDADNLRWVQVCSKDDDIRFYLIKHLQAKMESRTLQIKRIQDNLALLGK